MILNLANYISGIADRVGIPGWKISRRYVPEGSLEETYAFVFEGVGSLPDLLDRANGQFIKNINTVINEEKDQIILY